MVYPRSGGALPSTQNLTVLCCCYSLEWVVTVEVATMQRLTKHVPLSSAAPPPSPQIKRRSTSRKNKTKPLRQSVNLPGNTTTQWQKNDKKVFPSVEGSGVPSPCCLLEKETELYVGISVFVLANLSVPQLCAASFLWSHKVSC